MFRKALLTFLFLNCTILLAQDYRSLMNEAIQNGFVPPVGCGFTPSTSSQFKSACTARTDSYGTDCFNPTSAAGTNNIDPACSVMSTPVPACGTTFKVPIAITVFEDPAWAGSNYLDFTNCGGGSSSGFVPLTDADIDTKIAELNAVYCNANMEFYECKTRQRVNDPDLYNWFDDPSDPENGINDDDESAAYDNANVIDIYFVGGINGDHDCAGTTGYARLPPSRDYFLMVYRGTFGTTFEHEFGHYFGLAHTHYNTVLINPQTGNPGVDNPDTNPVTQPENTDPSNCGCLTTDDRICDTWPDPNFAAVAMSNCSFSSPPQPALPINPNLGTQTTGVFNPLCAEPVSTVLLSNIMGYNQFQGCRTTFSPCQLNKIQDALFNCRSNLCCDDPIQYFAAGTESVEICAGDPAPIFTANTDCVDWYGQAIAGTALASGVTTFAPTIGTGIGQLDNMTAGSYSFYVQDRNAFGDCRT